ncbi:MAG: hypothetical protein VXX39_05330 [Candidatus Thermoplasmatota archaeon]|nr:hypothetical protein [Candidatus Thermoplasmatota archaeon]
MVVRTNLDERIINVKARLNETFILVESSMNQSIKDLNNISLRRKLKANEDREKMRTKSQEISQDLLIILTLNSPLLLDLRIITAFLRCVDSLDRITAHQRQITAALQKWSNIVDYDNPLPEDYLTQSLTNFNYVCEMRDLVKSALISSEPMRVGHIAKLWKNTQSSYDELQNLLLEESKSKVLGKHGRMQLAKVSKYIERTGYEYNRIASNWYFALTNEWINLDELDDFELTCDSPI